MKEGSNDNYELFKICKNLLIVAGFWASNLKMKTYKAYSIGAQLCYLSCIVPLTIGLIDDIRTKDIEGLTLTLKSITFVVTIMAKMNFCQTAKVTKLISWVMDEEDALIKGASTAVKKIYSDHATFCTKLLMVLVTTMYVSCSTNMADALYQRYLYSKEFDRLYAINDTLVATLKKPHPVHFWYPFDKDRYYVLSMGYECFHIAQSVIINCAAQALINSTMIFIRAEICILQYQVSHYRSSEYENPYLSSRGLFKVFAMKHQEIIRWVDEFDEAFQYILLVEYGVTSVLLATTLIDLYQGERMVFNATFFSLCFLQLFILAWNANEILVESSLGLMNALYESHWYLEKEKKTKVIVQMMMMRSLKPLALSIGPFGKMTMDAAVSRVKLAYSVLSVLPNKA